jgi:predicted nucleic acid-binding protein
VKRVVIDASIALAWVHPAQATTVTDELLDEVGRGARVVVPALWAVEVANALLVLERRKKLRQDERLEALATLLALNAAVDEEGHRFAFTKVSELALAHGLSAYDASYLELALRERLPLATKDEPLRQAASKAGVRVR